MLTDLLFWHMTECYIFQSVSLILNNQIHPYKYVISVCFLHHKCLSNDSILPTSSTLYNMY